VENQCEASEMRLGAGLHSGCFRLFADTREGPSAEIKTLL